jgi:hypothetical protein
MVRIYKSLRGSRIHMKINDAPACNVKHYYPQALSNDMAQVTCERCFEYMKKRDARRELRMVMGIDV